MASIRETFVIKATPGRVWAAVRKIGDEQQLFRGVVAESRRDDEHRIVTFANGSVVRERIVDIDEGERRLAYAVVESPLGMSHHHAILQVLPHGDGRARVVWTADLVPHDVAGPVSALMRQGAAAMTATLESGLDPDQQDPDQRE